RRRPGRGAGAALVGIASAGRVGARHGADPLALPARAPRQRAGREPRDVSGPLPALRRIEWLSAPAREGERPAGFTVPSIFLSGRRLAPRARRTRWNTSAADPRLARSCTPVARFFWHVLAMARIRSAHAASSTGRE